MYLTNIMHSYLSATDDDIKRGIVWYDNTRALATQWANGDVWKGAGVIAAYSPMTPWWRNLELAEESLLTGKANPKSTKTNVDKATRILAGEDVLTVLKGPKLKAFASAIADPNTNMVTVDQHIYSVAMGRHFTTKTAKFGIRVYRAIAADMTEAAQLAGMPISEFQAALWVYWRRTHPNKGAQKGG